MKLLLTSSGISNPSIHAALLDLLGKPIEESSALCIPTAIYSTGPGAPASAYRSTWTGSAKSTSFRAPLQYGRQSPPLRRCTAPRTMKRRNVHYALRDRHSR